MTLIAWRIIHIYATTQLMGSLKGLRCIRVDNYRIIFEVQDKQLNVLVVRIGHRIDIYQS